MPYNPAEHRVPTGSGRASGRFAPGRVSQQPPKHPKRPARGSTPAPEGGGGPEQPGAGGGSETSQEEAFDAHARAMAQMDLNEAAQIEAQIKSLKQDLANIQSQIAFWSKPANTAAAGSSATSTGATSSSTAQNKPGKAPGASTSSGSSGQSFTQFLNNLKSQASQIKDHIGDLKEQVRFLRKRAAQWLRLAKFYSPPEIIKDELNDSEIIITASQLEKLLDVFTQLTNR